VIESSKDAKKGVSATVIVKSGTLSVRQDIYTDTADGRVKRLSSAAGESLDQVKPGFAAEIIGFKDVPSVGAVVRDINATYPEVESEEAEDQVEGQEESVQDSEDAADDWGDLDFSQFSEEKTKLDLIIKADVEGTLEAILQTIDMDSTNLIHSGLGSVTESDLEMATTSDALIISFHTKVPKKIKILAKNAGVRIKSYKVIYKLIEDLQKRMLKLMEPTIDEVVLGEAEILQIFEMKGSRIAGSRVKTGEIKKSDLFHLVRDGEIVINIKIKNMMHGKEEITSVKAKNEFGATFANKKLDFRVGDMIVAYKIEDDE
jgi:translation initiation factor IF-2